MIDLDKFDKYFGSHGTIRKHVLARLEHLREAKIIGKSIEAGVKLLYNGRDPSEALWESNAIREALNVSWVELHWQQNNGDLDCGVVVWDLKKDEDFCLCNRCYKYHIYKDNYNQLCDGCIRVMLSNYASHPTMDDYFNQHPSLSHTRHITL